MSPGPVRPTADPSKDPAVTAAAQALLAAVESVATAYAAERRIEGEVPPGTLMTVGLMALMGEVAKKDPHAPFSAIACALASLAVAQGIGKHQLMAEINKAITPTFASPLSRQILKKAGRA